MRATGAIKHPCEGTVTSQKKKETEFSGILKILIFSSQTHDFELYSGSDILTYPF